MQPLKIAVVGAGYWGPNLIRNFSASPDWTLVAVCDRDLNRARAATAAHGEVDLVGELDDLLARDDLDAVAIATPAGTHRDLGMAVLRSGRHVLIEKPLASSVAAARELVDDAAGRGLVLMCDHTYCYTPTVQKIADLIGEGVLGDILFVDSVRINLGLVQPDVNVIWDLAPHDLSILDYILPGGLRPPTVAAHGADPIGAGQECVGYLTMPLAGGGLAHVHVNWLSPTKIRSMVIGGSRRTLVWDDLNPQQRLSLYDRGVELRDATQADLTTRAQTGISYRTGDMFAPALPEKEALASMVATFASSIRSGEPSATDGLAGLRVLAVLEAASSSLRHGGAPVSPFEGEA